MKMFAFLLLAGLFSSTTPHAQETIIRITNGEWEPYLSEYSYEYGAISHIINEAFKLEGIDVIWGFYPWRRSYILAEHCTWDASAAWWPTKEAKENFLISEPIIKTHFVFFHVAGSGFQWKSFDDLKAYRIGTTIGYDYGDEFMTAVKEKRISIQEVRKDELNYSKLLAKGRIDIFPNDPIVGYAQIRNSLTPQQAARLTHHPKKFAHSTLNLIMANKCPNSGLFMEKFNAGFKKLKDSGRIDQIYKDLESGKYDKQKNKWNDQQDRQIDR